MTTDNETAVWWVKRDFRVSDNEALSAAAGHKRLLVLFIVEPSVLASADTSAFHLQAQLQAAHHLQLSLRKRGAELFFAFGEVIGVFESVFRAIGPFKLYAHQETGNNLTFERDKTVHAWCIKSGIAFEEKYQNGVLRGPHKREQRPAVLAQRLLQTTPLAAALKLPPPPAKSKAIDGTSTTLPLLAACNSDAVVEDQLVCGAEAHSIQIPPKHVQQMSEASARQVLHSFMQTRGVNYSEGISSPNHAFDFGSRLSAHLAWGTISLRTVFAANTERQLELREQKDRHASRWRKSLNSFQSRLYWHDHFIQRFESASQMEFEALNPAYQSLRYPQKEENLQAWLSGNTGIPLVDACIRCLQSGGFLNFRMRAMLVSVACYGLGLHWKTIQYPLARLFYDYEPGIHFSQVQMQAGVVGINTIRIYNPQKQLLEQDPECEFVRRWVAELSEFSAEQIARYQTQPLGDYAAPPADFEDTARLMKDRIFNIRNSDEGKAASQQVLEAHGSKRPSRRYPPRKNSSVVKSTAAKQQSNLSKVKADRIDDSPDSEQQQFRLDF